MKMKKVIRAAAIALSAVLLTISPVEHACAGNFYEKKTSVKKDISAEGAYANWDGVTNVSQFSDEKGNFCFAYDNGKKVTVVNGKKRIDLKKKGSDFGAVTCDAEGCYYVVTGKENLSQDTGRETVFVSKYDKKGKLLKTVGDNGSSSLASYYDDSFCTRIPFDAGNCDVAVNGHYLAVNYAREMYNGHQSNSLLLINTQTMKKVHMDSYYNSHSFAQRVVPYKGNFLLASEGDCYDRAFTVSTTNIDQKTCDSQNTFDFWVKKGTLDNWNMFELNNNFAHLGGVAAGSGDQAALVATSVKSLNENARKENEQLFIQIFNPQKDLSTADGYVTRGERSGKAGPNGDEKVTNYGIKWLTNYSDKYRIMNPQVVADRNGNYVILFERYKGSTYQGVYYMVLDASGKTTVKVTRLSAKAHLNPGEMPVYTKGRVYWAGNHEKDHYIYINSFTVE
ncbi:MAG: hypothetical protein PUB10_00005 [Clostridiales bacterium]|nr:hypothetical protein [Clostridiales bacterium]